MAKIVKECIGIIRSVREKVDKVQICEHQCRRLADSFSDFGCSMAGWKCVDSDVNGNEFRDPAHPTAFESLLTLLRMGETLVTECMDASWSTTAVKTGVHQELFEEIHKDLNLCRMSLLSIEEPENLKEGTQEAIAGKHQEDVLQLDARKDIEQLLERYTSCYSNTKNFEKVRTNVSNKFYTSQRDWKSMDDSTLFTRFIISHPDIKDELFLGEGDYGIVSKADWLGCIVAVKDFPWSGGYDSKTWSDEATPLLKLRHPHVMQVLGFCPETKKAVMDYIEGCNLREYIDIRVKGAGKDSFRHEPFTYNVALDVIRQVARALNYIHQNGYMHGDRVLTMNVIVQEFENRSLKAKLGDFGVLQERRVEWRAAIDKPYPGNPKKENVRWTAPEVYTECHGKEIMHYSAKADVYSFGVLCSEVMTGSYPFEGLEDLAKIRSYVLAGERPGLPNNLRPDLQQLIKDCWQADCTLRPSAKEICDRLDHIMFPKQTQDIAVTKTPAEEQVPPSEEQTPISDVQQFDKVPPAVTLPDHLQIPASDLKEIKKLGEGGCGAVYKAEWQGSPCAMKAFAGLSGLPTKARLKQRKERILELQNEVQFLMRLRHPHIVQLLGFSVEKCSIVMELMTEDLPTLYKRRMKALNHQRPPFVNATALNLIKQIASGMAHLHNCNIMHRDLKGANVLVRESDGRIEAKITDFGVSQSITGEWRGSTGTGFWRAPEIFRVQEISRDQCVNLSLESAPKVDAYAFAMTCYEILCGEPPFQSLLDEGICTRNDIIVKFLENVWPTPRPKLPEVGFSLQLLHLIQDCWHDVAAVRPTFPDIVARLNSIPT